MIAWVLLLGVDYEGERVAGVHSTPEAALEALKAVMDALRGQWGGPDYFQLEPHVIDSDETLTSFERRRGATVWTAQVADGCRADEGITRMLGMCAP